MQHKLLLLSATVAAIAVAFWLTFQSARMVADQYLVVNEGTVPTVAALLGRAAPGGPEEPAARAAG